MSKKGLLNILIVAAIPTSLAIGMLILRSALTDSRIKELLSYSESIFLWLNILFLLSGVWMCRKSIETQVISIPRETIYKLAAIILAGFLLRAFVAPLTHRIYYDEDIYLNIAQNMINDGRAISANFGTFKWDDYACREGFLNKQPNGFPALVSIVFLLFGIDERYAHFLNILISSLTPLALFFFVHLLYDMKKALWSSFFLALTPIAIVWSPTAAAEPAMTFFALLTFYLFALFCSTGATQALFAAMMSLAFAVQFRPEGILLVPLLLFYLILFGKKHLKSLSTPGFHIIWLIFSLLMTHHMLHLLAFIHENWGAVHEATFSAAFFKRNSVDNLSFFIVNKELPLIFTLFAILGIFQNPSKWKEKSAVILWLATFFIPFLFFYAGSYRYGADIRFCLLILCPFCILCAQGVSLVDGIAARFIPGRPVSCCIALCVILLFLPHVPFIRTVHEESWDARLDHDFIVSEARKLPRDAVIFSHSPCVIIVGAHRGSLQSHYGSDQAILDEIFRGNEHVYFYRDYWCYAEGGKENYAYFLEAFEMTPVATEELYERDYTLYRIKRK